MKINHELFELLSAKSSEILEKLEPFILSVNPLELKEYSYEEGITKRYILSSSPSKFHKELTNHVSVYLIKNGKVNSISFLVSGDVNIEEKVEKKNFWGKAIISTETSLQHLSLNCYPLVSKLEDTSLGKLKNFEKYSKETWIDFEQYIQEIKKINFTNNSVDIKMLESFKQFFLTLLTEYQFNLTGLSANLKQKIDLLDKNNDGKVDIIDINDFIKLLNKHQAKIIGIDKDLLLKFIRMSNFLKKRSQNIQTIFISLIASESLSNKIEILGVLNNQIHSYNLLVFHSINMIGSIIEGDLLTYYEIYETFDKLNVFNSNWENEVAEKLIGIGEKLDDLIHSIYNMEQNIVSELSHLSYVTQDSFEDLNKSVTNLLSDIESSINTNNLLTGIQTYQLYKINKKTNQLLSK